MSDNDDGRQFYLRHGFESYKLFYESYHGYNSFLVKTLFALHTSSMLLLAGTIRLFSRTGGSATGISYLYPLGCFALGAIITLIIGYFDVMYSRSLMKNRREDIDLIYKDSTVLDFIDKTNWLLSKHPNPNGIHLIKMGWPFQVALIVSTVLFCLGCILVAEVVG